MSDLLLEHLGLSTSQIEPAERRAWGKDETGHIHLSLKREGAEVIVEKDQHPVAVIRPAARPGRLLSQCIALAEAHGPATHVFRRRSPNRRR